MAKETTDWLDWTHWNYRVVDMEKGECFVLCEVFYNKNKIRGWVPIREGPMGSAIVCAEKWGTPATRKEAFRQLKSDLKKMQVALKQPILKISKLQKIKPIK
jgi:hypothetical protein